MRVLHLDSGKEMRGGQWQVLRLHGGLTATEYDSMLLSPDGSPLEAICRERGLPWEPLRALRVGHVSRRFDLVHAHDAKSHTLGALFARPPLVVSRRVAFPVKKSPASQWKYSKPARFLAVSKFVARQLENAGVPMDRITIVYDGVPVPAEPAHGDAVLIPYTLDPAKGMALAQRAAQRAGISAELSKDLEADLPRARALVYLTESEGLGSGVLLAMAHGVTVIASNTGGIPELIEDGVNGLLVPNDEAAVAAAFARINPEIGAAARHTIIEKFSEQEMVAATLEQYTKVLAHA
jgi:hypothetical protein